MRSFPGRGHRYDLAIVGAGITGSEAALVAAAAGLDVLLVTTSLDTVYMLAHGEYTLEPPPGSLMGRLCSQVGGNDGEVDRWELHRVAKYSLEAQEGLHLLQSNVTQLSVAEGELRGVLTWEGVPRMARATALAVGPFLGARLEQGRLHEAAGRLGEMAYDELFADLQAHGFDFERHEASLSFAQDGPPYTVRFHSFASPEVGAGFELRRMPGLFAGGLCRQAQLGYERAAAEGLSLGKALIEVLK